MSAEAEVAALHAEIAALHAMLAEREKRWEQRFHDQDRTLQTALHSAKEAVEKAETAQERRLDHLNQFREQSRDEQRKFATKEVVYPRLDRLESIAAKMAGAVGVLALIGVSNLIKIWTG